MSAFLTVQLDRSLGGQAVQVGILTFPTHAIPHFPSPLPDESALPTFRRDLGIFCVDFFLF